MARWNFAACACGGASRELVVARFQGDGHPGQDSELDARRSGEHGECVSVRNLEASMIGHGIEMVFSLSQVPSNEEGGRY